MRGNLAVEREVRDDRDQHLEENRAKAGDDADDEGQAGQDREADLPLGRLGRNLVRSLF